MRRLLLQGEWAAVPRGSRLTIAGAPVSALWFIEEGQAEVVVDNVVVATCEAGEFIGEMTVLQAEPAYAEVVVSRPSVVWQIESSRLRELAAANPEIGTALEAAFFRTLRTRLADSNARRRAEAVGA